MVKTVLSILISLALLVSAAVFELFYVNEQFDKFEEALSSLELKVREESANREDAEAVKILWEHEKKNLHVVIPHNDISYIDYWLGEAVSYIETKNFDDALSKIEVLVTICRQIPQTYGVTFENIF
mgnify:FL=1